MPVMTRRHFATGAAALAIGAATGLFGRPGQALARPSDAYPAGGDDDPLFGSSSGEADDFGYPDARDPSARPRNGAGAVSGPPGTTQGESAPLETRVPNSIDYARAYAAKAGGEFPVPAAPWKAINPSFLRQVVSYSGPEAPGTIIVDPRGHHLLLVVENGRAMRYGVGVGKAGFAWSGTATIKSKQEWPDWYPPKEMIARTPGMARQMSELQSGIGMHGGLRNPLGARAMYLWQGNKDTLFRIHGTVEPLSIGKKRLVRLHPHARSGRHGPLQPHADRHQGRRPELSRHRNARRFRIAACGRTMPSGADAVRSRPPFRLSAVPS